MAQPMRSGSRLFRRGPTLERDGLSGRLGSDPEDRTRFPRFSRSSPFGSYHDVPIQESKGRESAMLATCLRRGGPGTMNLSIPTIMASEDSLLPHIQTRARRRMPNKKNRPGNPCCFFSH